MFVACYLLLMHAGFHPWVKILSQGWGCLLQAFFQTTGVGDGGGGEGLRSRATGFWLERSIRHWWGGAGGHTAGRRGGGDPAASGGGAVAAVASLDIATVWHSVQALLPLEQWNTGTVQP